MADWRDLDLKTGDVLVVHACALLAPFDRKKIADDLKREGVGNTVLVIQAEPRFEVLRAKAETEKMVG